VLQLGQRVRLWLEKGQQAAGLGVRLGVRAVLGVVVPLDVVEVAGKGDHLAAGAWEDVEIVSSKLLGLKPRL